jgi:hypothetical protein
MRVLGGTNERVVMFGWTYVRRDTRSCVPRAAPHHGLACQLACQRTLSSASSLSGATPPTPTLVSPPQNMK